MTKKYRNNVIVKEKEILKKYNKNIFEIYEIFEMTNYTNYPKIIEYDERNIKYEKIEEIKFHEKTKGEELIKTVALLHEKTLEYKEVGLNKYNKINKMIKNNINYLKKYYTEMIEEIENQIYMSPSNYLIARNYSMIINSLEYAQTTLKKWYKIVENKTSERVCVIHNNLKQSHFIKSNENYLISFDGARVDSPILDLYKLYKNESLNLNFNLLFEIYNNNFQLLEEEKLLFFTLISIPTKIIKTNNEYADTYNINNIFKYIYKTTIFINKNK